MSKQSTTIQLIYKLLGVVTNFLFFLVTIYFMSRKEFASSGLVGKSPVVLFAIYFAYGAISNLMSWYVIQSEGKYYGLSLLGWVELDLTKIEVINKYKFSMLIKYPLLITKYRLLNSGFLKNELVLKLVNDVEKIKSEAYQDKL